MESLCSTVGPFDLHVFYCSSACLHVFSSTHYDSPMLYCATFETRINISFFLLDNRPISNIHSCDYHSIVISDHAPTSLDIQFPIYSLILKPWRFNSHSLSSDPFVDFLRSNIQLFFEINDTPQVSKGTLWEAFKAYLRGHIISYTTHLRKILSQDTTNVTETPGD